MQKKKVIILFLFVILISIIGVFSFYIKNVGDNGINYDFKMQISSSEDMHFDNSVVNKNNYISIDSDAILELDIAFDVVLTVQTSYSADVFEGKIEDNETKYFKMQLLGYNSDDEQVVKSDIKDIVEEVVITELLIDNNISYIEIILYDALNFEEVINVKRINLKYVKKEFDFNKVFVDSRLKECIINTYNANNKQKKESLSQEEVESMEVLICDDRKISNISGIEYLSNLFFLDLSENSIKQISSIKYLTNLKFLFLSDNLIEDVTPLAKNVNLETLTLHSNQIHDVSSLVNLKKLHRLPTTYNNAIANLDILESNLDIYYANNKNDYYEQNIDDGKLIVTRDFSNVVGDGCNLGENYSDCMSRLQYEYDVNEIKTYKQGIEVARDFVNNNIKDEMKDIEKEAIISNYIMNKIDYRLTSSEVGGPHEYYYIFVLNYGQCHHYAQMFNLLAYMSGLESYSAFSGVLHEWNVVKIDGIYYHLDLTWEDDFRNLEFINISTDTMNELHGAEMLFTVTPALANFNFNNDMDRYIVEKYFE